jgi:DUF3102 family protein
MMHSTATTKILTTTISDQINIEHQACMRAAEKALEHAMQCGDLLIEAKAGCKHGEWQGWLEEHFESSPQTARVYMRVADNREQIEAKRQSSGVLSIDGALKLLATSRGTLDHGVPNLDDAIAHSPEIKGLHEAATLFPLPDHEEHFNMVDSILEMGLLAPVYLTENGLLIDGKWRVLACYEAGVDLRYKVPDGDPVDICVSLNLRRNNYTEAEIATAISTAEAMGYTR